MTALFKALDDTLGGRLAEIFGVQAAGEVDSPGAGFGRFQAGIDSVLASLPMPFSIAFISAISASRASITFFASARVIVVTFGQFDFGHTDRALVV